MLTEENSQVISPFKLQPSKEKGMYSPLAEFMSKDPQEVLGKTNPLDLLYQVTELQVLEARSNTSSKTMVYLYIFLNMNQ